MNTRVLMILATGLYLMAFPQLQAERLAPQVELKVEVKSSLDPQVELLPEPSLLSAPVMMFPVAGELVPDPTFVVHVVGKLISKATALSDGDLYLFPQESSEGPKAHPVPLIVTRRHQLPTMGEVAMELIPSEPLIVGASYELQAKTDTNAEFIDMSIKKNIGQVWKVVPPNKSSSAAFPTDASPSFYNPNFFQGNYPRLYLSAILENVEADLSGFITLGMDGDGKLLSVNTSKWTWKLRTSLMVASNSCLLDDKGWTDLRSVEVILLGKRGERGELTIPVRVNPVVTSTFGALSRLYGKTRCIEDN